MVGQQARELDERGLGEARLELSQEVQRLVGTEEGRARLVKAVQAIAAASPADGQSANEPPPPTAIAVLLAVFGWTLPAATPTLSRSDSTSSLSSLRSNASTTSSPILSCTLCLRQVLASPYLPTPSSGGGDIAPSTPAKTFDPVKQHQPFCPFVDASAGHAPPVSATATVGQVASKGAGLLKPGWQVRLEAILQRPAGLAADARGAHAGAQESEGPEQGRAAELAATGKVRFLFFSPSAQPASIRPTCPTILELWLTSDRIRTNRQRSCSRTSGACSDPRGRSEVGPRQVAVGRREDGMQQTRPLFYKLPPS